MGKSENQKKYVETHRAEYNRKQRESKVRLKQEALKRYGEECKHCGFSDYRALQIDHVNNDGAKERNSLGGKNFSGHRFYRWLKFCGWPEGYQTLCANCNIIKYVESRNEVVA
jgi:hypothetical protein